ncbi:phosphoribosylamine--glycine ligase [Nitratidesulfovibrio sp. D1]|uniref:phosphoribosylamine--glycine ligase n=1 Tax=Nitratidesulfovibrio sp. D1 TaxID=3440151 RepID=UPI003EBBFDC0
MRILIVGSGGREHALAWKLRQSPLVKDIFIAPGNGGTALEGANVPISDGDLPALVRFALDEKIDLVVPGPELPLVLGIKDAMAAAGVPCFGPDAYGAQLEGSKAFAKEVMRAAGVPTADFGVFDDADAARAYIRANGAPVVVKADGLAAGKGVVVARTVDEALEAVDDMMVRRAFGDAGARVVVESALAGEEASFLCLCDGETVIPLPSAQDHKAVFDNDQGPNTGGMGAYSPAPVLPESRYEEMIDLVIRPVLRELIKRGHPFTGVLYAGLMMTGDGPMVLEFNTRFGDPECQPLLMRLDGDLAAIMVAGAQGRLHETTLPLKRETALGVVMAAKGYPGDYARGMAISGIEDAEALGPVKVFQAGTERRDGVTVSRGGRVLCVTALGDTLADAQALAYRAVAKVRMDNAHYRSDIGAKGLKRAG